MALGINKKNLITKNLLGDLAFADCYHDFSNSKMFNDLLNEISKMKKIIGKDGNGEKVSNYIKKQISNENPPIKTIYNYFE